MNEIFQGSISQIILNNKKSFIFKAQTFQTPRCRPDSRHPKTCEIQTELDHFIYIHTLYIFWKWSCFYPKSVLTSIPILDTRFQFWHYNSINAKIYLWNWPQVSYCLFLYFREWLTLRMVKKIRSISPMTNITKSGLVLLICLLQAVD